LEALLPAFIFALLAEWGDKTQLLVVALAARHGRPGPLLAGVALAALINSLIAATGGIFVHGYITLRAISLLVALALIFAGVAGAMRRKTPAMAETLPGGAFLAGAFGFFLVEFGDKTQFVTFALAAQYDSLLLTAAGATAGVIAASAPAALLGTELARRVPVRAIRLGAAGLFLIVGLIVAVNALRLV
jgi:putative Ca2+/H+ antiporter (TMEM165/GDT1 family)